MGSFTGDFSTYPVGYICGELSLVVIVRLLVSIFNVSSLLSGLDLELNYLPWTYSLVIRNMENNCTIANGRSQNFHGYRYWSLGYVRVFNIARGEMYRNGPSKSWGLQANELVGKINLVS